ncbi:MAG: thioredoxin family protein [Actinomycetes bacterium]
MDVTLQYVEECRHWQTMDVMLQAVADEFGLTVAHQVVRTPEEADVLGFPGSPTVLIDGRDPFATGDERPGVACRLYPTPNGMAGSPTVAQLREALTATGGRTPAR